MAVSGPGLQGTGQPQALSVSGGRRSRCRAAGPGRAWADGGARAWLAGGPSLAVRSVASRGRRIGRSCSCRG